METVKAPSDRIFDRIHVCNFLGGFEGKKEDVIKDSRLSTQEK